MTTAQDQLRVCMLTTEVWPYSVAGELSDVLAALPQALVSHGVEVKVFSPFHGPARRRAGVRRLLDLPPLSIGRREYPGGLLVDESLQPGLHYFVSQQDLFDREGIYVDSITGESYPDDFERFNFFMLGVLEALRLLDWRPHVIHCHDSQAALVPAYLKLSKMGDPFYREIASLLTIHNLSYQSQFPADKFQLTGLPPELFRPMGPFEYYGKFNQLKAGICYSDLITTVSRQYAREIQTPELGCGLHEVLRLRRSDLHGILNGIDTRSWDPQTDPLIEARYSEADPAGKLENKRRLQKMCGFEISEKPLIGMFTRLPEQEGIDLFLRAAGELRTLDCQWLVLATGLRQHQRALEELVLQWPEKFFFQKQYSDLWARQLHAGCDMLLMPSRYEPCGLNQMYSMRYGTIPIVRHCGGLADTVLQFNPEDRSGQGFKFYAYETGDLVKAVRAAVCLWDRDKEAWRALISNAMRQDFSWERSAEQYIETYRKALQHR